MSSLMIAFGFWIAGPLRAGWRVWRDVTSVEGMYPDELGPYQSSDPAVELRRTRFAIHVQIERALADVKGR